MTPEPDAPIVEASAVDIAGADPLRFVPLLGLLIVLLGGTILAYRVPPFQPADEYSQICRAWQVAGGGMLAVRTETGLGGEMPAGFVKAEFPMKALMAHPNVRLDPDLDAYVRAMPLEADQPQFVEFRNTASYMGLNYVQFLPAIWIGRLLNLSPVVILTLARLSNVLFMAGCVWATLRIVPCYRIVFLLLLTMPSVLALAGAVTADSLALVLGALMTAWWLRCRETGEAAWSRRDWVLLLAGAALLGWAKFVYLTLLWLWFLMPESTWPNRAKVWKLGLAACAMGLLAAGVWLAAAMPRSLPMRPKVNAGEQIRLCLEDPMRFPTICWNSIKNQHLSRHVEFIGSAGHADAFVGFEVVFLYSAALLLAGLLARSPLDLKLYERGVIAAVVLASTVTIFFGIYVTWNDVGAGNIEGLQGRYFLPLAPAAFLLMANHAYLDRAPRLTTWLAVGVSLIGLTSMVMAVNLRFYG